MMEFDELQRLWSHHEKQLVATTRINRELFRKLLVANTDKKINWIKIKSLIGLILPLLLIIFIVIPRIQFTLEIDTVVGIVLFVPLYIIAYIWAIRLYLLIEKLNLDNPVLSVRKQLKIVERYKLRTKKNGYILAPFMVIGIFLSAGIPLFSSKMILFYILMVASFFIGWYVRSKYGLVTQIRKIDRDLEEIAQLEHDPS